VIHANLSNAVLALQAVEQSPKAAAGSRFPMGGSASTFSQEELDVYEACTCLSGAEILELYEKFTDLGGVRKKDAADERVMKGAGAHLRLSIGDLEANPTGGVAAPEDAGKLVKQEAVINQSELRNNPFRMRLCQIFSTIEPGKENYGDLSFDEYVDLYNVMSPRAPLEDKMQTAFRMYDYDDNGYLTRDDIKELLVQLSTPPKKDCLLEPKEVDDICDRVMRDCDIDGNNRLSYAEFSKVLNRIPDFAAKFRIYIQ